MSFEVLMENDRSPISGLKAVGEHLVVFKRDSMWRMVYNGPQSLASLNSYTPGRVPGNVGTTSYHSIQEINGNLIFLAEGGVYVYNGTGEPEKISDNIQSFIDRIPASAMEKSVSVHWSKRNCYLLAVALDGSDHNNHVLVYDYKAGAWWVWDGIDAQVFMRDELADDSEVINFGDHQGSVFRFDENKNDDHGAIITSYVELHRCAFTDNLVKTLREVRIVGQAPEITALDIECAVNDAGYEVGDQAGTVDMRTGSLFVGDSEAVVGATALVESSGRTAKKLSIRRTGDWMNVKITNNEKYRHLAIDSISLGLMPKGIR